MSWVQSATDVYGGKNGEYESLDEGHKDLKGGEGDQASEGERPDDQQEAAERGDRQYGERHEQDVAGEHVGEQTHAVAERAKQKGREQLDEAHERPQEHGNIRRPRNVFDIAKSVVLDPDASEYHQRDQCQHEWTAHAAVGWHLEERDYLGDVADEHEDEEGQQQ